MALFFFQKEEEREEEEMVQGVGVFRPVEWNPVSILLSTILASKFACLYRRVEIVDWLATACAVLLLLPLPSSRAPETRRLFHSAVIARRPSCSFMEINGAEFLRPSSYSSMAAFSVLRSPFAVLRSQIPPLLPMYAQTERSRVIHIHDTAAARAHCPSCIQRTRRHWEKDWTWFYAIVESMSNRKCPSIHWLVGQLTWYNVTYHMTIKSYHFYCAKVDCLISHLPIVSVNRK